MCVTRHAEIVENETFAILQYLKNEVSDEDDFYKHISMKPF